jgi:hypothetical protein
VSTDKGLTGLLIAIFVNMFESEESLVAFIFSADGKKLAAWPFAVAYVVVSSVSTTWPLRLLVTILCDVDGPCVIFGLEFSLSVATLVELNDSSRCHSFLFLLGLPRHIYK